MTDANLSFRPAGASRTLIDALPFLDYQHGHGLWKRHHWPAQWIGPGSLPAHPIVFACRRQFTLDAPATLRLHVSADERYALFVDGQLEGRGPERGDWANWFFETYDLKLNAGRHTIVALVWALGPGAPMAQISSGPAFMLAAEEPFGEQLSTGRSAWQVKLLDGVGFLHYPHISHDGYTGKKLRIDGSRFPRDVETGAGDGWSAAVNLAVAASYPAETFGRRSLTPARMPAMLSRPITTARCRHADHADDPAATPVVSDRADRALCESFNRLLNGAGSLSVPARSHVRLLVDLDDYYCAYTHLTLTGGAGALVRIGWAESLYVNAPPARDHQKGHRDQIDGKYFRGFFDEYVPDGSAARRFSSFWWQAGRYVQIEIRTADQPLTIDRLLLEETRYPFGELKLPRCDDPKLTRAMQIARRALETGVHETYTDSPYFEQLAYIGDVRLEALTLYHLTDDDRPTRKAIIQLDQSRSPIGFTQSCYPSRTSLMIAPYALLWIGLARDFLQYRGDKAFLKPRLPGVRAVIDGFFHYRRPDGLIALPPGWNFFDWSPGFAAGELRDPNNEGTHSVLNWQIALGLRWAIELERAVGEPELVARFERLLGELTAATHKAFWVESEGLWSDDLKHERFSEHAQALSILAGSAPEASRRRAAERLASETGPQRAAVATIYFTHYVIEALRAFDHHDAIDRRLDLWRSLPDQGLRALPEEPEPTRSDCHGWGAHVIYQVSKRQR